MVLPGHSSARHRIGTIVAIARGSRHRESLFADVFVPDGGIFLDVIGKERDTFLRIEIDDFDTKRAQPFDAALECPAFADDNARKIELPDQAAAIPARSQRSDHGQFLVAALAAGVTESVSFSVQRWIVILHAAIVSGADECSMFIENCRANGNAAFSEPFASFGSGHCEHGVEVQPVWHGEQYTQLRGNRGCDRFGCVA